MATSLDDVLSGTDAPVVEKPAAEPPADKPASEPAERPAADAKPIERVTSRRAEHRKKELAAQGRDPETGQFIPKAPSEEKPAAPAKAEEKTSAKPEEKPAEPAKPASPPQQDLTPRERAAFAKAADEARKRQALELELARLKSGQPQPEKPKFWDNPEQALQNFEKNMKDGLAQTETSILLKTSERLARQRYPDFDEKLTVFEEIITRNPALVNEWISSPDPAEFAYSTGKGTLELRQAGGMDKLLAEREAKARADERAKVEAEFKKKEEEREKLRAALPGTLSDVHGAAPRGSQPVFSGPTPLNEILKPGPR